MDQIVNRTTSSVQQTSIRVEFTGQNGAFRRLVSFGALLEIITFGFYRFWLMTNMRRHLWSRTAIAGDALEYTGRGFELLIGFLFALAVLLPLYILFFFVSIEAERLKAFLSLPLILFFYGFGQFAVYRARRYRLTRTVWRGVRFWMTGSGLTYAVKAFGWMLLNFVTLGLAYPWSVASLERYKMGNSYYGDLQGEFTGNGWTFFKRGWWLWVLAWIPAAAYGASIFAALSLKNTIIAEPGLEQAAQGITSFNALFFSLLLAAPFIWGAFKAVEWKWWLESVRFGDVFIESDLKRGSLIGIYWKLAGMSFLAIVAGSLFAGIILGGGVYLMYIFGYDFSALEAQFKSGHFSLSLTPLALLFAVSYLGLIQALSVIRRIYLVQRIWKTVAGSVTVHNLSAASDVMARGEAASAFGEGLADGLDLAGF